jgi:succinate dehydrogenase / fumarate reductase, cytochrome b subunit
LNWLRYYLNATLGRKILVGLSGLFLIGFLAVHLAGNLFLYLGPEAYSHYAQALHANSLLPVAEVVLFAGFLVHIAFAMILHARSSKARPEGYAMLGTKQGKPRLASSKTMVISGLVVLAFLVLHLMDMKFEIRHDSAQFEDSIREALHTIAVLQDPLSAVVYFVGSLLIGYHLNHGFQSTFQSLGLNHPKFSPVIKTVGFIFALIVGVGFASFPVWANFIYGR